MAVKLLLGILKGAVLGAAVGVGFHFLDESHRSGWVPWILYGVVGLVVGVICGAAFWKKDNWVTTILKGLVGFGVGVGIYAAFNAWLDFQTPFSIFGVNDVQFGETYPLFGAALGGLWGLLLEFDEGLGGDKKKKESSAKSS
jgi:hypothetical protein